MKISDKIKGMDVSTLLEEEECGAKYYDDGEQKDLFEILKKYGVNSIRLRLWNDPYGPVAEAETGEADARMMETGAGEAGVRMPETGAGEAGARMPETGASDSGGKPFGSPSEKNRKRYGAGTNDFERTVELSRRAKAAGMTTLLDFHYSDFWADPGKQFPPKAWADYDADALVSAVYEYTKETLTQLKKLELLPYMVQVGNELTNGCCWPLGNRMFGCGEQEGSRPYFNPVLKRMLQAGIQAVRETDPEIIVMLHLDNGGNNALYRDWFDGYFGCKVETGLKNQKAWEDVEDFDVIGLSYYPFWHGNLKALEDNMRDISLRYGRELVVAEVSMGFSMEDYRRYEIPEGTLAADIEGLKGMATRQSLVEGLDYPMTPEGQAAFMKHLNRIIDGTPDGLCRGYYYWEPAWIPVPGCGWATEASLSYIHDRGPCGNEWANQALFDYEGNVLPALKV